jgi:hypothetical protein
MKNKFLAILAVLGWILFFLTYFFSGSGSSPKEIVKKQAIIKGKPVHKNIEVEEIVFRNEPLPNESEFYQKQIIDLADANYDLQIAYMEELDSLSKLNMFKDAIKLQEFEQSYKDDLLEITAKGIVQGEVKSLNFDYKVTPPQEKAKIMLGSQFFSNKNFDGIEIMPTFAISKTNKAFSIGYSTEKRISVGTFFVF